MKKFLLSLALTALLLPAAAQHIEGQFTQTRTLLSGKVIKSEGTIRYTAPDQLAMMYTRPKGDYFIIDGPFLRMDMRGMVLDVNTEKNKTVRAQRNAILYSMAGKYEDIAREMDADCSVSTAGAGGRKVVLKMRNPLPRGYSGMELDYDRNGKLTRMVLKETAGICTEYLIS